jgi:CRISPR/Cas system-associated endonuclease Cas1
MKKDSLEPAFGFLYEPAHNQISQALVYDLQEPFRWLCDVTVIEAFESEMLDLKDFYFMGDDYCYHVQTEA